MIAVILCLALIAVPASAAASGSFPADEGETLRNLLLTEAGTLVLGSNTTLRRLSLGLSELQAVSLPPDQPSRLLVGDPGGTYSNSFLSCSGMSCSLLGVDDITEQTWGDSTVLLVGEQNARGLFVTGSGGQSLLTVALQNEMQPSTIIRGVLDGVDTSLPDFDLLARQSERAAVIPREFLAVFENDVFSYYLNRLVIGENNMEEIRLVRLCHNDSTLDRAFASHFEIKLQCGDPDLVPTAVSYSPTDQTVTVSVATETDNSLCVFELSDINQLMTEKYDSCIAGVGNSGLTRVQTFPCVEFVGRLNPNITECNLVSDLLPAQEVVNPLTVDSVLSLPLIEGTITSLIHSTLDNVQFLFAGTNNGKIYQYRYDDSMSINFIRNVSLFGQDEVDGVNVTQFAVAADGLTLYALTPSKLFSLEVDICDSFTSCETCLGDKQYPICGWCSLENRCSRQSECNVGMGEWVSDNSGSCPVISSADPSTIYVKQLQTRSIIDIDLATVNIPGDDNSPQYQCRYNFLTSSTAEQHSSSVTMDMDAERSGDRFTCTVQSSQVPSLPRDRDLLLSTLSLRYSGNDVAVLSEPIRFANCSVHTNCTSCVGSEAQCNWCPFTFKCIASRDEACSADETPVTELCPKLLPPENGNNYLIHVDFTYEESPLVIRAANLDQFSTSFSAGEFSCVLSSGTRRLFSTSAELDGEKNVKCVRDRFDYTFADGEASLDTILDVEWNSNSVNIDNPNRTGVTLYSCEGLGGSNCAQCLAIANNYHCSFCIPQFSCLLDNLCTTETIGNVERCSLPTIEKVLPTAGPTEGGTMVTVTGKNIAVTRSQITNVTIGGVACMIQDRTYQPGVGFQCETGRVVMERSYPVRMEFNYLSAARELSSFRYEMPTLSTLSPLRGPQAGGTMVTITGSNLNIGSSQHVTLAGVKCYITSFDEDEIVCRSKPSDTVGEGVATVVIDNWSGNVPGVEYRYETDPTVTSISPAFSFTSGGTNYVVLGENFDLIQEPRLLVHLTTEQSEGGRRRRRQTVEVVTSQPCLTESGGTRMTCQAPPISHALSSTQQQISATLGLQLDGVDSLRFLPTYQVMVYSDPSFENFGSQSFSNTDTIQLTITSKGERKFEFTPAMVVVRITPCSREECVCGDITFQQGNTSLVCEVESTSGLSRGSDLTVTVHLGSYNQTVGKIRLSQPTNPVIIIVPIAVTFVIVVMVVVFILLVVCYRARVKDSRYRELIVEMEKLESSVARECKLGFAELQTDLDELTGDLSGYRLPYHDLKVYLLSSLFPGSKDHPVLHPVQLPLQRQISSQRAIKDFYDLCMDKKVLLLFIRTLEEQRNFTIRDKSLVGSLLMVALHSRLDYATEILKMLLSDLIGKAIAKSSPKLLLRRTESVAEKMLTNWLAFCLHGYIVEQAGKPLYLLYRAVKSQLEKGPIDVITGEARYSLSEHKLIRQKMDVEVLLVSVEGDDGMRVPVKVLSCDTISQAKEKLLDAIYKATPVSQRPALTSIDLEYIKSPRDYLILRDEDTSTAMEGAWKRLNTLQHYGVQDGATFRLMKRKGSAPPGRSFDYPASLISSHAVRNRALSEAEDGSRVWHLFKQHDVEDPKRSPFMNKKMITEVYLPRMLSTKNILQKFVDDLFASLFSVSLSPTSPVTYTNFFPTSPGTQPPNPYCQGGMVPMAIKYLLDFLDDAAEGAQISERDVVHTWKNNALALRFWVNLMKNPEFVFDVNKSHTVDACLSVIAGAFIDGCSYADVKLTIDSPTGKLLYNKDVQEYKTKVRQYYQNVSRLPRIPEDAMQSYLKQLSEHQAQVFRKTGGFVVESALYELLRYGNKYSEQLLANLRDAGLDARAQVFESIVRTATI